MACLQPSFLGKVPSAQKTATAQLTLVHDATGNFTDIAMASLYAYNSLMMFRTLPEIPLAFRDAIPFMQYLLPATVIAGIHHPDVFSDGKEIRLLKEGGGITQDVLTAKYEADVTSLKKMQERNKLFKKALRQLGCYALKCIQPAWGASIHYAGTLPYNEKETPLTLNKNGKLGGTNHVYVADGSGFCYLPAKGITFTLMANAHRTAIHAMQQL